MKPAELYKQVATVQTLTVRDQGRGRLHNSPASLLEHLNLTGTKDETC